MVVVIINARTCRLGEVFFDIPRTCPRVDFMLYRQVPNCIEHALCEPFETRVIDLSLDTRLLFNSIDKNTRYDIRRASARDELHYTPIEAPTLEDIDTFVAFHREFSQRKGIGPASRSVLASYVSAGVLDLSRVSTSLGETLVWHAHYRTAERVRLLYSASDLRLRHTDNSLLGRANRYHHWRDMLRFKDDGVVVFDLGGWAASSPNAAQRNVSAFKAEFGGRPVREYNCRRALTPRGYAYLAIDTLMSYLRRATTSR